MNRCLLALVALIAIGFAPAWAADTAKPAAIAADYPAAAPAPGAPVAPAVKAGLDQAQETAATAVPWYKNAGGVAIGIAASVVLAMLGVARHSTVALPQPWGALLSLAADGAYALLAPRLVQMRDKQLEHHEDTVYTLAEVVEQIGDNATIKDLKAKMGSKLPSAAKDALNLVVSEVKADLARKAA